MHVLPLLFVALSIAQSDHEQKNPLFHEMATRGVLIGPDLRAKLPAPVLADGLDAASQKAAIKKVIGSKLSLDEFLSDALIAKHFYSVQELKPADPKAPAHQVDLYFVAHGDFDRLLKQDAESVFNLGNKDTKLRGLKEPELAKRKLSLRPASGVRESYLFSTAAVFDTIQVSMTTHTMVSQTPHSLLVARRLEPAFNGDLEFPNQWQKLKEDAGGKLFPVGDRFPYEGFAQYIKFTRLADSKNALFVEFHQVFTEPKGWFDGQNVLRTKLPLLIQNEVRNFRRELKKWSSGN